MQLQKRSFPEKWILLGIPVIIFAGSLLHFVYEWSGGFAPLGLISPINESIWEHTKLSVFPILLWWTAFYLFVDEKYSLCDVKWFTGMLTSIFSSILLIIALYYGYTGALGIEKLWADILIFCIAVIIAQLLGLHVYHHSNGLPALLIVALVIALCILYAFWTVQPPALPLFEDPLTEFSGL